MRAFILRVTLAFIMASTSCALPFVYWAWQYDPNAFISANLEKLNRLRSLTGPKIVLVGGSNLAFGIDSGRVEERTGRGTVNMGLHYGLPLELMLRQVAPALHAGDVVVLGLEYEYYSEAVWDPRAFFELLSLDHRNWALVSASDWARLGDDGLILIGTIAREDLRDLRSRSVNVVRKGPYQRLAFNRFGDIRSEARPAPGPRRTTRDPIALGSSRSMRRAVRRLEEFTMEAAAKGASVVITYPPVPVNTYQENLAVVGEIDSTLRHSATLRLIDTPGDLAYPPGDFGDTRYHLTRDAAVRRTDHILERLRPILEGRPPHRLRPNLP